MFEWILNYLFFVEDNGFQGPELELGNIVPIMIFANILKIDRLMNESLIFFIDHIETILQARIDISDLNSNLIREISRRLKIDRLD